ncbi:MAG: TAT-variant-translocated molybdopterin oxidoreductase [Chthonomonadales bacterium]
MIGDNHNDAQDTDGLHKMKSRLAGRKGQEYWRSLEELADTPEFRRFVDDEFPNRSSLLEAMRMDRRSFLTLMGSSIALAGLSGCRFLPAEKIVPYVQAPEDLIPGVPVYYATAAVIGGYGVGVLVESHEGRPTKIEGNPGHPASLGSTDALVQATLLDLYDPERSQNVSRKGQAATWDAFFAEARKALGGLGSGGDGLRVLTGTVTSPTLARQMASLLAKYPAARWHRYDPAGDHNARTGTIAAFGKPVMALYHLDKASRILALDADFLQSPPSNVRYARDFAQRRRVRRGSTEMSRLYALESTPGITGAVADHRKAVRPAEVEVYARAVAAALGPAGGSSSGAPDAPWAAAVARDLAAHRGASVVIPGQGQPAAVHALAHAMNQMLGAVGNTVTFVEPAEADPVDHLASLQELVADMRAGKVKVLLIIGGNPAYTAPADLEFAAALGAVPFSVHLGRYEDETSQACLWHLAESHYLEAWSDVRAFDGTASIVQPLIQPLYSTRSAHEVLAELMGEPAPGLEIVQNYWKEKFSGTGRNFQDAWRKWLNDGVVPGTASPPIEVPAAKIPAQSPAAAGGYDIIFRPDPNLLDGTFANNAWLMELPRPLTKLTWDNAALMSPATAVRLGLASPGKAYVANSQVVELAYKGRRLKAPLFILPGHADDCVTLHLGWGRSRGGSVCAGKGVNAYALQTSDAPNFDTGLQIRPTQDRYELVSTHYHSAIDMEGREPVLWRTFDDFVKSGYAPVAAEEESNPSQSMFQTPAEYAQYDGYAWGMTIDLNVCIGCNACVVACQAENNIPVVGKDQVSRGREMHWIRIDRYYQGTSEADLENPVTFFEPVPCMQCELAPCEPVCPVGATTHSHEGLNQMVYNRCVGTRYCSNNCPYKVRRFNFYKFSAGQPNNAPGNYDNPTFKLMANPNVTVRGRGVMEKCTYCVQRINEARIKAKERNRVIRDGEIQTACQQACPTKAIVFGNIHDAGAEAARLRQEPAKFVLLGELNTRPRTTYLAKFRNLNPEIRTEKSVE